MYNINGPACLDIICNFYMWRGAHLSFFVSFSIQLDHLSSISLPPFPPSGPFATPRPFFVVFFYFAFFFFPSLFIVS